MIREIKKVRLLEHIEKYKETKKEAELFRNRYNIALKELEYNIFKEDKKIIEQYKKMKHLQDIKGEKLNNFETEKQGLINCILNSTDKWEELEEIFNEHDKLILKILEKLCESSDLDYITQDLKDVIKKYE